MREAAVNPLRLRWPDTQGTGENHSGQTHLSTRLGNKKSTLLNARLGMAKSPRGWWNWTALGSGSTPPRGSRLLCFKHQGCSGTWEVFVLLLY